MNQRLFENINVAGGPLATGSLDIDTGLVDWRTEASERRKMHRALLLMRHDGWPVGVDLFPIRDGELSSDLGPQLLREVPASADRHAAVDGTVSVVICTRNRPQLLVKTLEQFVALRGPAHEIVVVDNAPINDASAQIVAAFGDAVRYVVEPTPGLARARNCGLEASHGRYVAFTDDDVDPDPAWLEVIGATFAAHPGAVCLTGSVLPSSLQTHAELLFQEFGGYLLDFQEAELHLSLDPVPSPLFPFHPKLLGTGANMAFRHEALRAIGGFDPALGAGTPSRGGEDIDVAVRVLLAGHLLIRQPAAVLWHPSHTSDDALLRQVEDYGCGLSAAFTKFMSQRRTAPAVLRRLPAGLKMLLSSQSAKNRGRSDAFPMELRRAELRGISRGPFAYHSSAREVRATRNGIAA